MGIKDVFDIGKGLVAGGKQRRVNAERTRFEHGKQDFMMEIVTKARTLNVTQLGFSCPNPGTVEFEYCEALVGDGFLERNILEGKYFVKSPYSRDGHSLY